MGTMKTRLVLVLCVVVIGIGVGTPVQVSSTPTLPPLRATLVVGDAIPISGPIIAWLETRDRVYVILDYANYSADAHRYNDELFGSDQTLSYVSYWDRTDRHWHR